MLASPRLDIVTIQRRYDVSLLSQMRRKGAVLPHFQGVVVDRSDWNQMVNLDGDDGVTLLGNSSGGRTGWSMQHSYLQVGEKALL